MISLINWNDANVLDEDNDLKNAVMYKDMLAFYDAYTFFMSGGVSSLPNYCVSDGRVYLDGMCLLIKDYCSEFNFETLDLTLDYLKVLYYSIAKFSTNGNFPKRESIVKEFEDRKKTSDDGLSNAIDNAEESENLYKDAKNKLKNQEILNDKQSKKVKNTKKFSIISTIILLICSALFIGLGVAKVLNMVISIIVAIALVIVVVCNIILCKKKVVKLKNDIENNKDVFLKLQSNRDYYNAKYKKSFDKRDLLKLEIYNYIDISYKINKMKTSFNEELLAEALNRNMLSYNLKYDIIDVFNNHSEDIKNIVKDIAMAKNSDALKNIYSEVCDKYWLYNNNYVRYAFIEKIILDASQTHNWQIEYDKKYVNPFGINIKDIYEEKVSFLQNEKSLFINMPLSRLIKTNIFLQDNELKLSDDLKVIDLKRLKMNYAKKFYNYEEISKIKNISYLGNNDLKHNKTIKSELIEDKNLIPQYIDLKIKLIEVKLNCENSHHSLVKETIEFINEYQEFGEEFFEEDFNDEYEVDKFNYDDYVEIPFDALNDNDEVQDIEQIDDLRLKYTINGETIIGYKF